jgi:hypothetical protein
MTAATFPTPHGSTHAGRPSVLARYDSLREVRTAIEQLEGRGVDGDDLALVGEAALAAERTADRAVTDRRFLRNTGPAIAAGAVAGAIVGALIGVAILGITFAIWEPSVDPAWVFGLMTAWFAAGGAVFGAFVAVSRRIGFSESWPLTFEDEPDEPLWLAVYDDREGLRDAIVATHPVQVVDGALVETTPPPSHG